MNNYLESLNATLEELDSQIELININGYKSCILTPEDLYILKELLENSKEFYINNCKEVH